MTTDMRELDEDQPLIRLAVIDAAPDGGVGSAAELDPRRGRVLDALEAVFPVRFERDAAASASVDALIQLGGGLPDARPARPTLVLAAASAGAREAEPALDRVRLADRTVLPRPLRGQAISQRSAPAGGVAVPPAAQALATVTDAPVWWLADGIAVSRYPLAGLADGEPLSARLRAGTFMELLPLVVFLEGLLGDRGWRRPAPRACFVLDDPNLHRPTYGFVDYRRLAEHAAEHGYHVAMATVPIDNWLVNRRAAAVIADSPRSMSLLIHGNDHVAKELGRLDSEQRAVTTIAQALRRTAVLERRSGLAVDRIVAPPHGACSEHALGAMFRLGMDGACISRPYPWLAAGLAPTPLAGWHPAELVTGGLPVLPRYPLSGPREELALRALLGQPLILYGHHGDLADGLDVLAQAAADVNALGETSWERLSAIARASFSVRRVGERMLIRLHGRRVSVQIPPGVSSLRVELPEPFGGPGAHRVELAGRPLELDYSAGRGRAEALPVTAGDRVEIVLHADRPLAAEQVPAPRTRLWPWVRRALAEGRDRVQAGAPF
jgi:hypothetical protein